MSSSTLAPMRTKAQNLTHRALQINHYSEALQHQKCVMNSLKMFLFSKKQFLLGCQIGCRKTDYLTLFYLKSYGIIHLPASDFWSCSDIFKCRLHCAGAVDWGGGALVTPNSSLILHRATLHIDLIHWLDLFHWWMRSTRLVVDEI
jgi:hypothetical protein